MPEQSSDQSRIFIYRNDRFVASTAQRAKGVAIILKPTLTLPRVENPASAIFAELESL